MKNPIVCAMLTSTLVWALPAMAQDVPSPVATPAAPSPDAPNADAPAAPAANPPAAAPQLFDPALFKLYLDVVKDLKQVTNHHATLKEKVDLARNFSFSADTKAELQTAFGNDNPLHIAVEDLPEGGAAIHARCLAMSLLLWLAQRLQPLHPPQSPWTSQPS